MIIEEPSIGKPEEVSEAPVLEAEAGGPVVSPKAQRRKHGNPKGKGKEISDSVGVASAAEIVPDSAADEGSSEQEISNPFRPEHLDTSPSEEEEDQLQDDDDGMQDGGDNVDDSDESYQPSASSSKKMDTSKSNRAPRKSTTGRTAQPTNKAKTAVTPGKEKPIMLRIPRLKTAPAEPPKRKTGGQGMQKMQASNTSIKQSSAQQRKMASKPRDTPESDPLGPMVGKGHESTQPPLFLPTDKEAEDETVKDVIQTLEGNYTSQEKIDIVRSFFGVIDSVGSNEDLKVGGPCQR